MSELQSRAAEIRAVAGKPKPVETFPCVNDPLTGWAIEPAPTYRRVIPVYDAQTGELREFLP